MSSGPIKCAINAILGCYGQLQFVRLGEWRYPMLRGFSQGVRNCPVPQEPEGKMSIRGVNKYLSRSLARQAK